MKDITELSNKELFDEWVAYSKFLDGDLPQRPSHNRYAAHYAAELASRLEAQGTPDGWEYRDTRSANGELARIYRRIEPPKPRWTSDKFGAVFDRQIHIATFANHKDAEDYAAMKNQQAEA